MPRFMQSRTPFSTDGMKLRGTAPPKMSSTNSKPPPRWSGSTLSHTSPYCPRPPVCFLYLPWTSARPLTVSLYGMRGGRRLTSTLYLRFIRSTTVSTWSWPMPETRSCFVSGS